MKRKEVKQKALPTGWREVKVIDFSPLQRGFDLPANEIKEGSYPVVYSNGIKNYHSEYKSKAPGVVTGRSGTIGEVTYVSQDYWPHNTSLWVTDFKGNYPKFVFYSLKHLRMDRFDAGSGVPTLNRNDVHKQSIFAPPLVAQKAIVSLLEKWDTAIEKTEALIAAKEKQFKWLLKTLISDQQDNPEWRKVKLGKVIEDIGDGGTPSRKNSDYFGGGIPWVVIDDITFKIEKTKETLSKLGLSKSTAKIWPKDSVIVSTGATIGHVGIAKIPMATKQGITGIIPKKSITSEYLAYFLLAHTHLLIKYAQGSSFKEIRPETTKKIAFSYPEINLQKDMVSKLNTAQKETDMLRSLTEQYRTQKRGLMQKLLTGKWRLPLSFPRKRE